MTQRIDLRAVKRREEAWRPAPADEEPISTANNAVPLLWLSLFDYAEVQVRREGDREVFAAVVKVVIARSRADVMQSLLPAEQPTLQAAAKALFEELERTDDGSDVALYPLDLFGELGRDEAKAYLQQLVYLSDLWERLRSGLAWAAAVEQLTKISPEFAAVLQHQDERLVRYFLVGSLADKHRSLDDFRIREGQGAEDEEPEALAVGEQGLLIGRFDGTWKLMSSGSDHDLTGVWGDDEGAYLVGRAGTLISLKKGRCSKVEVPTQNNLRAVWGLGAQSVCAVGDAGTVIAFNGELWQQWPIGSNASLHCIWGSSFENICIGGEDGAVMRYDGYGWSRAALPVEGVVNSLCGADESIWAVGGSKRGGEVFRLGAGGWTRDESLPRLDWLELGWRGWGDEVGGLTSSGLAVHHDGQRWTSEQLQLQQVLAVGSGETVMVAGVRDEHTVLMNRSEAGWQIEATLRGLRLFDLWIAGNPKPPRLPLGALEG